MKARMLVSTVAGTALLVVGCGDARTSAEREAEQTYAAAEREVSAQAREMQSRTTNANPGTQARQQNQQQQSPREQTNATAAQKQGMAGARPQESPMPAGMVRASALMGAEVRNEKNEALGEVTDLALETQSGRIAYAVVKVGGGTLDLENEMFAVPLQAFSAGREPGTVVLPVSEQQLEQMKGFPEGKWPASAEGGLKGADGLAGNQSQQTQGVSEPSGQRLLMAGLSQEQVQKLARSDFPLEEVRSEVKQALQKEGLNEQEVEQKTATVVREVAHIKAAGATAQTSLAQRSSSPAQTWQATNVQESAQIALREEQLNVQKREVAAGGILLRKKVVTEDVTRPVQLREETIEIVRLSPEEAEQRRQQGQGRTTESRPFSEQEIFIPLMKEEPVVQKEIETREYVRARKETETNTERVRAQLRREELEIERRGAARQRQEPSQNQEQLKQQIRQSLTKQSGNAQALLTQQQLETIQISVNDGVVTLQGKVSSNEKKAQIEERAKSVPGVRSVKNELTVGQQ